LRGVTPMRTPLVLRLSLALVMCAAAASRAFANCPTPTPVGHLLDSWFICPDTGQVTAYAYEQSLPAVSNSDSTDILCETVGGGTLCYSGASGSAGDGLLTISGDWFLPTMNGCPTLPGRNPRVVVVTASGGSTGSALLVSVSGASPELGYALEAAQPFDATTQNGAAGSCATPARRK